MMPTDVPDTATRMYRRSLQGRRRRQQNRLVGMWLIGLGVAAVVAVSIWGIHATEREVTTRVNFKERVCDRSNDKGGGCQYLVFTEAGTLKLTDSIVYGNFRSSDVYGRLRQDQCYRFTVTGWRLPVFSQYPNIVRAEPVSC